jgi:hypothetical protein
MKAGDQMIKTVALLAFVLASGSAGVPLAAQEPEEDLAAPAPRTRWGLGARGGLFEMTNSPDAYDAVFGEPMPSVGAQLELDRLPRWRFAATLDYGQVEGERVLLTDPPRGTGVEEELRMIPLHVTAAWRLRPLSRWDWYLGAGPSLLDWENEGAGTSNGSTDTGGSVVLGLRRQREPDLEPGTIDVDGGPRGWRWGGELRWSTFPDALPDTGVSGFFGEDDPGGVTLTFVAMSPLGGRSRATPTSAGAAAR